MSDEKQVVESLWALLGIRRRQARRGTPDEERPLIINAVKMLRALVAERDTLKQQLAEAREVDLHEFGRAVCNRLAHLHPADGEAVDSMLVGLIAEIDAARKAEKGEG